MNANNLALRRMLSGPWMIRADAWSARQHQLTTRAEEAAQDDKDNQDQDGKSNGRMTRNDGWIDDMAEIQGYQDPIKDMRVTDSGVAIVPVTGALVHSASPIEYAMFGDVNDERLARAIGIAATKADNIILDFDCPGGSCAGVNELSNTIERVGTQCSVYAFTGGSMTSKAYWLASSCSAVFAAPSSTVGNIGVICSFLTFERQLDAMGVSAHVFADGEYKSIGMPMAAPTAEHVAFMQSEVERLGEEFRQHVATRRTNIKPEDMRGQWFGGMDAMARGLVDGVAQSADELAEILS